MPGMLLYRFADVSGSIDERLAQRYPAVQVEQQQFLDDVDIYHGELADKHYREQQVAHGTSDGIVVEPDEVAEYVHADWIIAPEAGFAGISTGDAQGLLERICIQDLDVTPREARIDIQSYVEAELESHRADIWAVSYSDGDEEEQIDPTRAGSRYHRDARLSDIEVSDVSLLGVDSVWNGRTMQALLCESGWVAAHEDTLTTPEFARWIHDCVGPHLLEPISPQTTIGGVA